MTTQSPRYLVCVDGREESITALRLACMKARTRGGSVSLLHVITPADFQTLGAVADKMREEQAAEGDALLRRLIDDAHANFGVTALPNLREGSVGEEIIAASMEDNEVIMLVIGVATESSKRGKLASWLASQLGIKLQIPLLMVPGNLTDQQLETLV